MLALTTTEAAALTGLDERAVRKDVEHGILDVGSPPRFAEAALVYLRACATFAFHLAARDRRRLYASILDALDRRLSRIELGPGWSLDVEQVAGELRVQVDAFEAWRARLVTRADLLAGEPVFPGTRLSVRQIGEQLRRGASTDELQEDYPELTGEDLSYALLFTQAYPRLGRPRASAAG